MRRPNQLSKCTNEKIFPFDSGNLRAICFESYEFESSRLQLQRGCGTGIITGRAITMAATAILAMGIITTGAFIIAPLGIQVTTMATATTVAIIATIIGRTMINRGPLHASDCADSSRVWQTRGALFWAEFHTDRNTKLPFVEGVRFSCDEAPL